MTHTMCDIHRFSTYCEDCGAKFTGCKCERDGVYRQSIPQPRFSVGDLVYRREQTNRGPLKVLDRALVMDRTAECDDGYDGHQSRVEETLHWRYKVTCHWKDATSYYEEELATREEHVPYVVWYYGPFSRMYGIEHTKEAVPDLTEEEYSRVLAEVEAVVSAKKKARDESSKFPFIWTPGTDT